MELALHVFYWCAVCDEHCTNHYPFEGWEQHKSDLEDAKLDILVCPRCQMEQEYFAQFAGEVLD